MNFDPQLTMKPADWYHRLAATLVDLALLGAVVKGVAYLLPEGPPPADAMAFFSKQDFYNYFVLVGTAFFITTVGFVFVAVPAMRGTPGQIILGLRLCSLSGSEPLPHQIRRRWLSALVNVAVLAVPGPLVALLIGVGVANLLEVPFTTTDRVLVASGIPAVLRYSIHGVSFIALFAAIWYVFVHPALKWRERSNGGLTVLDTLTNSTHVKRGSA
jgi:uncharacterized RDD family membrane protein YckC